MKAAVFRTIGAPLTIEDIAVASPGPGELLIRTVAAGVCHSDLSVMEGKVLMPTPAVLGHESAGVVEAVGEGVSRIAVGDHVVTCVSAFCGYCEQCLSNHTVLCETPGVQRPKGQPPRLVPENGSDRRVFQVGALGGYAEMMLVNERTCVAIRKDMPLDRAALLGCAVVTGLGAVMRTAKIEPGSTVAVIGCGGVGLCIVSGAKLAGASRIIAIDRVASKEALAMRMGATDFLDASAVDAVEAVAEMTRGGVHYSFEAIGLQATVEQAFRMVRPGGVATMVGIPGVGRSISVDSFSLLGERRLQGSMMGSNKFLIDIPNYVELYLQGRLDLDALVSRRIGLEAIDEAFEEMRAGQVARSVVVFDS